MSGLSATRTSSWRRRFVRTVGATVFGSALLGWGVVATALDIAPAAAELAPTVAKSATSAPVEWWPVAHQLAPRGSAMDFTAHGTQPGLSYSLLTSDDCSGCHGAGGTATSGEFRPHPTWAGSMMANAMRDPLFLAALDVANHDVPGIGDYCLRCHTSNGWYGGHVVKQGYGLPDNDVAKGAAACLLEGSYDAPDAYSDYSGLGCQFCHRHLAQGPAGQPLQGNGAVWLDDTDCNGAGEPCRHGPYDYTDTQPPHAWAFSPFHTDSAMCGQCHDVTTPDIAGAPLKTLKLANGSDTGVPFPIERTFSEWKRSSFSAPISGKSCQDCHMPNSEDPDATACALGGFPNRTGNLPTHAFVGGNTWIPGVIKGEYSDTSAIPGNVWQGIGRQDSFDQTVDWARQMLQSAAAVATTISAYTAPTPSVAGSIAVQIKVTNLSGHKLPSGYSEGRRIWLNVQVHDAGGALVAESGAYDPASAVLSRDPQVRIYEVLQGIFNHNGANTCDVVDGSGNAMFHFALNDCIAKDNRIPPLGFRPATLDDPNGYEVRPVGATYPETAAGSGTLVNYDRVAYRFDVPAGATGPFTATARLYYQTSSREYIDFLRDEAVANAFQGENQMCSGESNRPFVVGPQARTRGEYMHQLWNNASDDPVQPGYGKSPPELIGVASANSADFVFVDGFEVRMPALGR